MENQQEEPKTIGVQDFHDSYKTFCQNYDRAPIKSLVEIVESAIDDG